MRSAAGAPGWAIERFPRRKPYRQCYHRSRLGQLGTGREPVDVPSHVSAAGGRQDETAYCQYHDSEFNQQRSARSYNHAFGSTLGGYNATFHHNLWACNTGRNPSVGMIYDFTFVNNVLFNWRHRTVDGGDHRSFYTIINNYFKPGPVTDPSNPVSYRLLKPEARRSDEVEHRFWQSLRCWQRDCGKRASHQGQLGRWRAGQENDGYDPAEVLLKLRSQEPYPHAFLLIQSAKDAYKHVLANAGATLPTRDAVDKRIIKMVRTGELPIRRAKGSFAT